MKVPLTGSLALCLILVLPTYGQTIEKKPPPPIPDPDYGLHMSVVMNIGLKYRESHDNVVRPISTMEDGKAHRELIGLVRTCANIHSAMRRQALVIPDRQWSLDLALSQSQGEPVLVRIRRELQGSQDYFQETISAWRSAKGKCVQDTNALEGIMSRVYSDYQQRYREMWDRRMRSGYREGY